MQMTVDLTGALGVERELREIRVEQPLGVRKNLREGLEVVRGEAQRHEVLAFLRTRRGCRHERGQPRRELLLHRETLLGARDPRVGSLDRRRWGTRVDRLPLAQ
jgi:hypothetical protein